MKKLLTIAAAAIGLSMGVTTDANAFWSGTHSRIVLDAIAYMKANPTTTNYAKFAAGAAKAGYTVDQFATVLSTAAADVDNFNDTYICGAVTGDCEVAPVWGLGSGIINYTCYWHFQNHTQGSDVHGNQYGGYNYAKLTVWGDVDNMAASWLYGDYLDDGKGGNSAWLHDGTKYDSYHLTEAHYRLGGTSNAGQYSSWQKAPFQPIDNLAEYWFQQFLAQPTAQSLGFALHSTDLLQPHHVWTTSALNHYSWESWVDSNYNTLNLDDPALVKTALNDFTPLSPTATDIRPLLTHGGDIAYSQGGAVLSATDDATRTRVAKIVIPHAIAMVVDVLNRASERF
jgi:hypothetical protein